MTKFIQRKEYLDFLILHANKPIIKVVSGIRRCGKSTLFEIYKNHLLKNGITEKQIVSINFEDLEFEELCDYKKLHEYIQSRLVPGKMVYVFLDEIQHCTYFEKAVDSLYIKPNIDIYLTGSNAYFMSGELATLLSGRYVELKMLPLSFKEYCLETSKDLTLIQKYNKYITESSFPYTLVYGDNEKEKNDYLRSIFDSVLLKDIVARYKIGDVLMLESVIRFVVDNIGNRLTSSSIANTMTSNGRKIDAKTVEKYLSALTDSFLLYQTKRYNIKGKQLLKLQEKYYIVDVALRYMLLGGKNTDVGHTLENVVYLELIRRGYNVYIGQNDKNEVDFVAQKGDDTFYYQVSATVRDAVTLKRELSALENINDHYPKYILTLDEDPDADYDGIKRINALYWLIQKDNKVSEGE